MKKSFKISIVLLIVLIVGIALYSGYYLGLKKQKNSISMLNNKIKILNDSIKNYNMNFIPVKSLRPIVLTRVNRKNNSFVKEVYLAISGIHNAEIELSLGKLDSSSLELKDTIQLYRKKDDAIFTLENDTNMKEIEGCIKISLPLIGRIYPFSERLNKWW